ncbi:MAG: hypothetical protein HZB46_02780 [Solirubrobacterales bacterium]|nr:hypothetical protein [Solirubrobacterales bacterium]
MRVVRRHLHWPSPAMAVALTALFVALGGTSYSVARLAKDSVTSNAIKNGAVHRADLAANAVDTAKVADHTLLAADFKAGQLPAGPQGVAGPIGPKGDPGATRLIVRTSSGHGVQRTDCLPGEAATGGGGHSPDGYVIASIPANHPLAPWAPNGPPVEYPSPTSWEARALKVEVSNSGTVTAVRDADVTTWVVCAAP